MRTIAMMGAGAASAVALVTVALWLSGLIGPAPTPVQVGTGTMGQTEESPPDAAPDDRGQSTPEAPAAEAASRDTVEDTTPPAETSPETAAAQPTPETTASDHSATAEPDQEAADQVARGNDLAAPQIDLFRLQPDGEALVAGQVASGWSAEIVLDGTVLETLTTGGDGKFAAFVTLPDATGPRVLSLRMAGPDGQAPMTGAQQIVIAPTTTTAMADASATRAEGKPVALAAPDAAPGPVVDGVADGTDGPPVAPRRPQVTVLRENGGATPDRPVPAGPSAPQTAPQTPDLGTTPATPRDTQVRDVDADGPDGQTTATQGTDTAPARDSNTPDTRAAEGRNTGTRTASASSQAQTKPQEPAALTDAPQAAAPGTTGAEGTLPASATRDLPDPTQADSPDIVLMTDAEGARVLQSPSPGDAPRVMSRLALDAISYSDDGDVQLAGRAAGDGFVRIYLDNSPVTTSRITKDGSWRTDLPQVDTGVYTLRIDEVTPDGDVTNRVETPFKREDRALLANLQDTPEASSDAASGIVPSGTPPTLGAAPVRAITVQPGNTLWAISRETYGEGILYVRVFEANADHIRDPDLIYPGQVFTLPQ